LSGFGSITGGTSPALTAIKRVNNNTAVQVIGKVQGNSQQNVEVTAEAVCIPLS
jgi:hypothetical protein